VYWVHIFENPKARLYVAHTDNVDNRVASHNRTEEQREINPKNEAWTLVWSKEHQDISSLFSFLVSKTSLEISPPDSR